MKVAGAMGQSQYTENQCFDRGEDYSACAVCELAYDASCSCGKRNLNRLEPVRL